MKTIITILAVAISALSFGQALDTTWMRQYDRVSLYGYPNVAEINPDRFIIQNREYYYEINANGDSLTGGTFPVEISPNAIATQDDFIYLGGISDANVTRLAKLDLDKNIIWTTDLTIGGSNYGEGISAIKVENDEIYVSGSYGTSQAFMAKIDTAGNEIWTNIQSQTTFTNLNSIIKLNDGNYLASGNLDDFPLAFKFNPQGDTLWKYYEPTPISFSHSSAVQLNNNNPLMICRTHLIELDLATGQRVDSTITHNNYYDAFIKDDTIYMSGTYQTSGDYFAFVETKDMNLATQNEWIKDYNSVPGVQNRLTDLLPVGDGFLAVGYHRDSIDISANTWNVLAVLFNHEGQPTSGINSISKENYSIFPNPSNGILNVQAENLKAIQVFNTNGQQMDFIQNANQLDCSNFDTGVYFIQLQFKNGANSVERIVIN